MIELINQAPHHVLDWGLGIQESEKSALLVFSWKV